MRLLYLVHDLSDPAVAKRTLMLTDGGATVTLAGFRRTPGPIAQVAGCPAIDLGRTFNGGFVQRLQSVIQTILRIEKYKPVFDNADLILARNLEMLAIAVRGRGKKTIVYESLDIHRLLLNQGCIGKALRALEGWLSKRASALITSSPAFISGYFEPMSKVKLPIRLVENKVYPTPEMPLLPPREPGRPWKIGWFGAIRCRKSLDILARFARESNGAVEIILRGRPALDQFDDFQKTVTTTPHLTFHGAYKQEDLAAIYREVHFNWAIDMFEEGLNSSWLLPNRIYEGGLYGAVPIALNNVETGRTLQRLGIGTILSHDLGEALNSLFTQITPDSYRELEEKVTNLPAETWRFTQDDCKALVDYLSGLPHA